MGTAPDPAVAAIERHFHEDTYRRCYIRGPEGILIGLAQELGKQSPR